MTESRHDRRQFINAAGASLAALAGAPELVASVQAAPAAPQTAGAAERVRISSSSTPRSTRWTRGRRGRRPSRCPAGASSPSARPSDIRNLAGKNTQTFDAKGMTVVPGFIDCHNHAGGETLLNEVLVGNPFEVEFVSIRSIIGKLRERAQKTPAGHVGRRLLLRRHQGERQARDQHPRSR